MADFCSLCGYADIDIVDIYNRIIRPDLKEKMKELVTDDLLIGVNVSGVCEHCGIVSFGINNKYDVLGYYFGETGLHKFGHVDEETLDLIIDKDDPKYNDIREQAEYEYECILRDIKILEENKDWMSIQEEYYIDESTQIAKEVNIVLSEMGLRGTGKFSSGEYIQPWDHTYYGLVNDPDGGDPVFVVFPYGELEYYYEVDRTIPITSTGLPTLKLKEGE
jgi:hypothetical protein